MKAAFKTNTTCYHLVRHVISMFSYVVSLLPPDVRSLSSITGRFCLLPSITMQFWLNSKCGLFEDSGL